ncbi:mucin-2-like protein [Lates japonicus]|uniref:Mucin-2-like protein n=1 Tax=Lates japonicus TaxID=270547 RepID=A0AAD3RM97_LATJO|nr:mucin-2-like protein [Lates japonicus]
MESGEWCQREGISTRWVSSNAPFELWLNSGNWIDNIKNGIVSWRAVTLVELRTRSDTGKANLCEPSCQLSFKLSEDLLLTFDPDGDESCTLSFSPTSSSNGPSQSSW